jgi:hypothetical protein
MDTGEKLQHELNELKLLVQGLSKISGFPVELLELMQDHLASLEKLIQDVPEPVSDKECVVLNKAEEMKRSLTLNDHFRFQRELFNNDSNRMSAALVAFSRLGTKKEALDYFKAACPEGEKADCFPDFNLVLDRWFPTMPEKGL